MLKVTIHVIFDHIKTKPKLRKANFIRWLPDPYDGRVSARRKFVCDISIHNLAKRESVPFCRENHTPLTQD